jgi:hypothetical protein
VEGGEGEGEQVEQGEREVQSVGWRDRDRRLVHVQGWNADVSHQQRAGKARAAQFTHESQAQAAHARNDQQEAVFRAQQGLPPLRVEAVRRYVTPELIRDPLGRALPAKLQARIYRAWCARYLFGVLRWIYEPEWAEQIEAALDREQAGWEQSTLALEEADGLER